MKKDNRPQLRPQQYPLFAHVNGDWVKLIDGRWIHFGSWCDDRLAIRAEELYNRFLETN